MSLSPLHKRDIEELYYGKKMSQADVAAALGVDRNHLKFMMKKFGIASRPRGEAIKLASDQKHFQKVAAEKNTKFPLSAEGLRKLYIDERHSIAMIAEQIGFERSTVAKWLHRYGIPARRPTDRLGLHAEAHDLVMNKVRGELRTRGEIFVQLSPSASQKAYYPDFVVLRDGILYPFEVEGQPSKKVMRSKITRAKAAGFKGMILYKYWRKRKMKEERIFF